MAKIKQIELDSGNNFSYVVPELDKAIPLYAINSTAYAVELSWKLEDCTQKGITIAFRPDGDPVPSNVDLVTKQLKRKGFHDPHWSMQWIRRTIETPCPGKSNYTDDNVPGQTI